MTLAETRRNLEKAVHLLVDAQIVGSRRASALLGWNEKRVCEAFNIAPDRRGGRPKKRQLELVIDREAFLRP